MKNPLLDFLFDWGPMPANLLALASAAALICSYLVPRLKKWRNPCLVLLLAYVIGAGVITNGILKEYWGRPRPKQVEQFGGTQAFRPFFLPDFTNPLPSKSFPCGHCSLGFYFFALFLVGKRLRKPWLTSSATPSFQLFSCGIQPLLSTGWSTPVRIFREGPDKVPTQDI
jgi:membrane-associated PAP2 superfamily phosphatase